MFRPPMFDTNNYSGLAFAGSSLSGMGCNGAIHNAPLADEVRAQLHRILSSPDFPASERNRRFLAFAVECSLDGRRTSGYEVATKVFGRAENFNASEDPIVRIEAGKLRRDLETYYLKSGKRDPVRIEIPKGSYRAVFVRCAISADGSAELLRAALLGLAGHCGEAVAAWRRFPSHGTLPVDALLLD